MFTLAITIGYDMVSGRWLSQDFVKKFAEKYEACCTKSTKGCV